VHRRVDGAAAQRRLLCGVRDDGDHHGPVALVGNRQRHPVQSDRTLLHAILSEILRDLGPEFAAVLGVDRTGDPADAVDVPLHDVAAERLAGAQRALEVDAGAGDGLAEPGAVERLLGQEELGVTGLQRHHGAADPGQRDRVADPERPLQAGDVDGQPHSIGFGGVGGDGAGGLHEAGEHRGIGGFGRGIGMRKRCLTGPWRP
jgi:hypothetical protein